MAKTVDNMLDVVYLNRRIEFLENALGLMLDEHQLMGVHLQERWDRLRADENFEEHSLQERLTHFFTVQQREGQRNHSHKENDSDEEATPIDAEKLAKLKENFRVLFGEKEHNNLSWKIV